MTIFTALEAGWYENEPASPYGWRKITDAELADWEQHPLGPDDRIRVWIKHADGIVHATQPVVLSGGRVIPKRVRTAIDSETAQR